MCYLQEYEDEIIEAYQAMPPAALSNPWFGVGGLERVYLAITKVKPDASIICIKNYHDEKTFSYYFGEKTKFPRIHDLNIMLDADSPEIYACMNNTIAKYFENHDVPHSFHLTNHWGLFQEPNPQCNETLVYFQPGVWEMDNIKNDLEIRKKYEKKLHEYKILANSNYMKKLIKETFDCDSIVLYPCTDTFFFQDKRITSDLDLDETRVAEKGFDIMIFSRLNPGKMFEKSMAILNEVSRHVPEARFLISGAIRSEDEGYLSELKESAVRYGLGDKITFEANPSIVDLKRLYSNSKLLVFLPRNEPLGLVAVEAMSAGVPVVGFNTGGITETVMDGKTGRLCEDEGEMIDIIVELLKNPEIISGFRQNSKMTTDGFSEASFLASLLEIIEK